MTVIPIIHHHEKSMKDASGHFIEEIESVIRQWRKPEDMVLTIEPILRRRSSVEPFSSERQEGLRQLTAKIYTLSHWLVRCVALTNTIYIATDWIFGRLRFWPIESFDQTLIGWAFASVVVLPLWVLTEWFWFGRHGTMESRRAVLVDAVDTVPRSKAVASWYVSLANCEYRQKLKDPTSGTINHA